MGTVKFRQGIISPQILEQMKLNGGERVEETYITPDGGISFLKADPAMVTCEKYVTKDEVGQIAEKVFEESIRKFDEEGFPKFDSETPLIYDLEARVREINRSGAPIEVPFEKIERLVNEYGVEEAWDILNAMYPEGFRQVIYSDRNMDIYQMEKSLDKELQRRY